LHHSSSSSTPPEAQLFSAFVFLTASIETEEYQDDARFNVLSRYRHKDIGVLNKYQQMIGYGSSFYTTCSGNKQDSPVPDSDVLVFKRTIPTVEKEDALKVRKRIEALMRELRVLTHDPIRKHENIVDLLGIAWETDPFDITQKWPVILMERASHGSLADYFENNYRNIPFQPKVSLALDVVLGLKAMHICGILHGDVKAENALVFANHDVGSKEQRPAIIKLADFGGVLFDMPETSTLPSGTRPWNAPEWQIPLSPASLLKTDVYSLGFLVYRILADGKHPFRDSAAWSDDVRWSKVEAMKAKDDQMLEYMCSITTCQEKVHTAAVHGILENTIRLDPSIRNLDGVQARLEKMSSSQTNRAMPAAFNYLPRQLQLRNQTVPFTFSGHGALDRDVARYVTETLQAAAARTGGDTNFNSEAKYALAVLTINGLAGSSDQRESIRSGLKWLKLAAVAGSDRAQAVYSRVCAAINEEISSDDAGVVEVWLQNTASRGFFVAQEELSEMGLDDVLKLAREKLSTRYGGVGADRFPESKFAIDDVSIDNKEEFDQRLAQAVGSVKSLQNSQPLSTAGDNILHFVSCCGLVQSLEVLLKNINAAEVNIRNIRDETPLLLACRSGHYEVAMMLYEAGGDPRIANVYGDTPLHWLLSFPDKHVAELTGKFLRRGADIDAVAQSFSYIYCGENAYLQGTPLMRAISRNRLVVVDTLLEHGAELNFSLNQDSAINLAARLHYPEILSKLLDKSRNTPKTVEPTNGISYLLFALFHGSLESPGSLFGRIRRHGHRWKSRAVETLWVLLEHGAREYLHDVPGTPGATATFNATQMAEPDVLAYLLDHGGAEFVNTPSLDVDDDPDFQGIQRYPISAAISSRRLESLRLLLQHGADARVRERIPTIEEPVTMLYLCAWTANDDPAFAKLLIGNGVDVGVDDGPVDYETPFACAVRNRCFKLADFMWRNGADPNAEFNEGLWFSQATKMTLLGHLVSECSISTLAPLSFLMIIASRAPGVAQSRRGPAFVVNQSSGMTVLHVMANNVFVHQDSRAEGTLLQRVTEYFKPDASMLGARDSVKNCTALELAIMRGNARVVRYLLDQGAPLSSVNGEGKTPLHVAREWLELFPDETPIPDESGSVLSEKQKVRLRNNRELIVKTIERYIESLSDDSEQD
jgi:ankyrin repeat protein